MSKIRGVAVCAAAAAPVLCGAWAGAAIHLGIARALSARKSGTSGTRIIACACGQKLRIPVAAEELNVSCSACRRTFSCPPVRLHFRGVSNPVSTIAGPGFLARSVIGPGEAVEGIVTYRETIENGAKIRHEGGALILYVDPNVRVEYP